MIKLIQGNNKDWHGYIDKLQINPYSTRVIALYNAYKDYPNLCSFWYQKNDKNVFTTGIAKYGGQIIIDLSNLSHCEELDSFIQMIGYTSVLCDNQYALSLAHNNAVNIGGVMQYQSLQTCAGLKGHRVSNTISIRDYYSVIKANQSDSFAIPDFNSFYPDISHRIRKGTAAIFGTYDAYTLVSVGCAVAVTAQGVILSGIATLPEYQRKGYATNLIKYIQSYYNKKDIYLHYADTNLQQFYKCLGFSSVGQWKEFYFAN
ncbi:MAG TPA: GNAT family N-acetyltransferase [Clostridiales bacterium]|nr:GNAT family N-acetyltransferase [Clostridiales bacterium]